MPKAIAAQVVKLIALAAVNPNEAEAASAAMKAARIIHAEKLSIGGADGATTDQSLIDDLTQARDMALERVYLHDKITSGLRAKISELEQRLASHPLNAELQRENAALKAQIADWAECAASPVVVMQEWDPSREPRQREARQPMSSLRELVRRILAVIRPMGLSAHL